MRRLVCVFLTVLLLKLLVACCPEQKTADYRVVPLPQEITAGEGNPFVLKDGVKVLYPEGNDEMRRNAEFLAEYVAESTGKHLDIQAGKYTGRIARLKPESAQLYIGHPFSIVLNKLQGVCILSRT